MPFVSVKLAVNGPATAVTVYVPLTLPAAANPAEAMPFTSVIATANAPEFVRPTVLLKSFASCVSVIAPAPALAVVAPVIEIVLPAICVIALLVPRFTLYGVLLLGVVMLSAAITLVMHPGGPLGSGTAPAVYLVLLAVVGIVRRSNARK